MLEKFALLVAQALAPLIADAIDKAVTRALQGVQADIQAVERQLPQMVHDVEQIIGNVPGAVVQEIRNRIPKFPGF